MRKTDYACEILGQYFATASALRIHCRMIIDKYLGDDCLPEEPMSVDDASFFIALVRLRDPDRIPVSTYVRRVVRCCRLGQIGRHVRFDYGDGTRDLIGWSKICGGKPASFSQISNAMRQSILPQMLAAYSSFFCETQSRICPKSGVAISCANDILGEEAIVHHDSVTFAEIRDMWFREMNITPDQLHLKDLWDSGGYELADGPMCESWQKFHKEVATLVVVSARWHKEHHGKSRYEMEKTA